MAVSFVPTYETENKIKTTKCQFPAEKNPIETQQKPSEKFLLQFRYTPIAFSIKNPVLGIFPLGFNIPPK